MTETKIHTQNAILQPHTQTHRFLTRKRKKRNKEKTYYAQPVTIMAST